MSGLSPGPRHLLSVVVVLACWKGSLVSAQDEISTLDVDKQTNSSISLRWEPPHVNVNYIVTWFKDSKIIGTNNTSDNWYTVKNLEPGTSYEFTVKVEGSSSEKSLNAFTSPNEVRDLKMKTRSNSSVTLEWQAPEGPQPADYTYWISWGRGNDPLVQVKTTGTVYMVDSLEAATLYNFTVKAERNGVNSSDQSIQEATVPNEVRDLMMKTRSNSSVTLEWQAPEGPQPADYTYWISWGRGNDPLVQVKTTETVYMVDSLEAATLYNFTVKAERNGVNSSGQSIQEATVPNEVRDLMMKTRSNSSVTLEWQAPEGPQPADYTYWISWGRGNDPLVQVKTTETVHMVDSLEAATLYNFTVKAERNGVNSSGQSIQEATVPNGVRDLKMKIRSNSSVTLEWQAPEGPQPADYTYWISWGRGNANGTANTTVEGYTVEPLEPGSLYEFTICSISNGVNSSAQMLPVYTMPNEVRNLEVVRQTNNSISVNWWGPPNVMYKVSWFLNETLEKQAVTNSTNFTAEGLTPGTWYKFLVWAMTDNAQSPESAVNGSTAPDPVAIISCASTSAGYGVVLTLACPKGNQESLEFEVGTHHGSWPGPCTSHSSVEGLQPARSYRATVWTLWAGMRAASTPETCHTESGGVIAGSIVGVLLVILLVGLLIFFLQRRHRNTVLEKSQTPSGVCSSLGDIHAENLAAYILENQKDSNYGFAEEYQELAQEGTGQLQTAALALENKNKNRFSNVLPYDWSRVPLQPLPGDPSSDYINASFIPGLFGPREYIATQGPLPQTVGDFWRLVWEQQSRTIVMLTNCVESGRVKCEHYWPLDVKPCNYGRLRVTLKGEDVTKHWTIRELQLFHMDLKESLFVRQFHYTAWPDHGVPRSPDPLLAFQALLRKWLDQNLGGGLPIVHCSAGVGRTGTLIALDVLIMQLQKNQKVGVQSFVRKMRKSRPLMVQTEGQYIFLYHTLLRFLQLSQDSGADHRDQEDVLYENVEAIREYEKETRGI
ncbi:receptor-type tyrosine-protein phosphatase H [Macrotis lagotis]|uniref:receptor-type tyrosine-protein phosphatase H n=1 Tax=Macrotis lagotis TaxID=92651 RepID=UPI003D68BBDE